MFSQGSGFPRCTLVAVTSLNHAMQTKNVNKKPSCCWDSRSYFSLVQTSLLYDVKNWPIFTIRSLTCGNKCDIIRGSKARDDVFCVVGNVGGKLKDAATRCVLKSEDASNLVCGRGSAMGPAGGAQDAPPDPLVGWGGGGEDTPSQERHASRHLDPRAFSVQRSLLGATFLAYTHLNVWQYTTNSFYSNFA